MFSHTAAKTPHRAALQPSAMGVGEVEKLSREVLAHIPVATVVFTPDLRVRAWDLTGVDLAEAAGDYTECHIVSLPWWAEDERGRWFIEDTARKALCGESTQFEAPYVTGSGRDGVMWFRVSPFRESGSDIVSGVIMVAQDMTEWARDRDSAKAAMGELAHRVKNMLALVSSIVNLNLRKATSIADAQNRIGQRLGAYARAQDLIFREGLHEVRLTEVIDQALVPYPRSRIRTHIEDCALGSRSALVIGLALHELGMNAVKYGALSNHGGTVTLHAIGDADGGFTLSWEETGGPTVAPPEIEGFGTTLTTRVLEAQTRGKVTCDYRPEGVVWTLVAVDPGG